MGVQKKWGYQKKEFFLISDKQTNTHTWRVITNENKGNPFTFSLVNSDKHTNTQTHKQTNYLGQLCVEI